MRKRFDQQYSLNTKRNEDTEVNLKSRDGFSKLILALKEMYVNKEYNSQIFSILEEKIVKTKKRTGCLGMDLWQIFVLAQTRLALNVSYDHLCHMANYDSLLHRRCELASRTENSNSAGF